MELSHLVCEGIFYLSKWLSVNTKTYYIKGQDGSVSKGVWSQTS